MPAFPKTEPETMQLADEMIGGLPQDAIYDGAPASPAQLMTAKAEFNAASVKMNASHTIYLADSQDKSAKLSALKGLMRQDLNFAENIPGITQPQLKLIGWDTKAEPTKLEVPGQCLNFELIGINGAMYDFDWLKPKTGGKVSLYELVVRHPGENKWTLKANDTKRDLEEEIELESGQWEVAVRAANDAGTGPVSSVVVLTVA